MRTSVVVSTYNNPRALAVVLEALARQTVPDFEIVVGDDGSGAETAEVIQGFAARSSRPVRHLWQADEGMRRGRMSNQAILEASGEYLVFLDGDCVPPAHWLAAHLAKAKRGWFVVGGKVLLNERLTAEVLAGRREAQSLMRPGPWWREIRKSRRLAMSLLPGPRQFFDFNLRHRCSWAGEDSSTFKEHLRRIGGFDERFTLVWDDADVGRRLRAAYIRGCSVRYAAPVLHLEHGRSYRSKQDEHRNLELFLQNQSDGVIETPYGLALHQ